VPSDLAYYAYGAAPALEKVRTYVQEQGVRHLVGLARRGLGATDAATQMANVVAGYEWMNAHPLADDASEDTKQTRALVLAALVHAQNLLQSGPSAAADTAYTTAMTQYRAHAAAMTAKETPSAFSLWLAGLGLDLANPVAKIALYGALGLGAYLVVPVLLRKAGGTRTL
jgi:hypothetical protein